MPLMLRLTELPGDQVASSSRRTRTGHFTPYRCAREEAESAFIEVLQAKTTREVGRN